MPSLMRTSPHTLGNRQPQRVALLTSGPPISLKVLYCLHALGIETDVLELGTSTSIAKFSRYKRRYHRLDAMSASGEFDAEATGQSLADYAESHAIDAMIGGDIPSTGVLDACRRWLGDTLVFPSSDINKLELLDDKWRFQQFMTEHGIPCPRSILLKRLDDADQVETTLRFPLIAKPLHGESSHGVVRLENVAELNRHLQSGAKYAKLPILLQEFASGQDADISILAHEGEIQCHVMHSRSNGCSLEFLENDAVLEVARKIAQASSFTGVANIDVRIDPSTNVIFVLECNPRFWYTLQASLWRGLNFVEAGLQVARGEKVVRIAPVGGRYHLHGCLLIRIMWNPANWGRIQAYNWRGLFQAVSDPLPFIAGRF